MPSMDSSVHVTQLRKRISKLEDVFIGSYQIEMKEGRKQNRRTSRLQDNIKQYNICVFGVPGEERQHSRKNI